MFEMSAGARPSAFSLSAAALIALIERTRFAIHRETVYLKRNLLNAAKDGQQETCGRVRRRPRWRDIELDLRQAPRDMPAPAPTP